MQESSPETFVQYLLFTCSIRIMEAGSWGMYGLCLLRCTSHSESHDCCVTKQLVGVASISEKWVREEREADDVG